MTKQKVIFVCIVVFVFSLVLTGCYNVERARLEAELEQTERERDDLRTRLDAVEQSPEPAVENAGAPGQLQQQVDEFMKIRDALQRREDELTKLRQAALAEAQMARTLMDKLAAQLEAERKKVNEVQSQLQQTQQAIAELQDKLK